MLTGAQAAIEQSHAARQAGARRRAALGAHRPDHPALGLRRRRPAAGRWHRAAQCLLPHSARHLLRHRRPQCHAAPRLSLQLHSHRPHLQHAGARQQRLPRLRAADPGAGSFAHHADRRPCSRRQPAPVLQLALLRFHLPTCSRSRTAQDTTPINMQGAILRDSYLDLRGYPHWAPLPNLESSRTPDSRSRALPI